MDFPEFLSIEILTGDITNGVPGSASMCPIALALGRLYPERLIEVDGCEALLETFDPSYSSVTYLLGDAGCAFVDAFDHGDISDEQPYTFRFMLNTA